MADMFGNFTKLNSIKTKMLLFVLVPVIICFSLASVVAYYNADAAVTSNVRNAMTMGTNFRAQDIETEFALVKGQVLTVANALAANMPDTEAEALFKRVHKSVGNVDNVCVGYADKRFIKSADGAMPPGYDPTARPWYKNSVSNPDKVLVTNAYKSMTTGKMIVSITKAVVRDGVVIGVAAFEVNLDAVKKRVLETKVAKTGYGHILDSSGIYVIHPTRQAGDYMQKVDNGVLEPLYNQLKDAPGGTIFRYVDEGVERSFCVVPIQGTPLLFITSAPTKEFYEDLATMRNYSIGIGLVTVVLLGLIIILFTAQIAKPLNSLSNAMQEVAKGDLTVDVERLGIDTKDEVGRLAKSCSAMAQNLRAILRQVSQATEQVGASSEELTASSEQSAQAANQIAASIAGVANGATEQLAAANETSAVVEQMSAGIQQVAANTNNVAEQSALATEKAKDGGKAVEKAVSQMKNIETTAQTMAEAVAKLGVQSKEIGQIVGTISGIAGQTNLLALNAAIEAARAGEQGRGFAVVAEEVRKLAEESQNAAKQIAELIQGIQKDTDKAVAAMNAGAQEVRIGTEVVTGAGEAFKEIVELVSQVSGQVREISAAVQQMASGSQQIVGSVRKIDNLSKSSAGEAQSVSAATEEQLASMEEISTSSQALAKLAQDLQVAVARFRV